MSGLAVKPVLRYLDVRPRGPVGGRGNACRLFFLANKIPFENELVSFADWGGGEKERVKKEGSSPFGHLPILVCDDRPRPEHISISRYVARKYGLYGDNPELDYETDAVADAAEEFRQAWAKALMAQDGDGEVEKYREQRTFFLGALESYYAQRTARESVYMAKGDMPGFGDAEVFNIVRDDRVCHGDISLAEYPNLQAMYKQLDQVPEVRKWIEDWEARKV